MKPNWSSLHKKIYEEEYEEVVGSSIISNQNNNMENGIFKLSLANVKSAVIYGVVAVILAIIANGTIFDLDWRVLLDVGVMGVLTSFVKNLFTTNEGNFAGLVKTVDEPK